MTSCTEMKFLALVVFFVVADAGNLPFDPQFDVHWKNFKKAFGKSYIGHEEAARRLVWEQNVAKIIHHNLRADVGLHSFRRGLNEYADMTHEEFVKMSTCYLRPDNFKSNASAWLEPSNIQVPDRVDWREYDLVTPVKNQMQCGSCWAFAATGSLEGQHKKKTGDLVSLSEQNLVDCSRSEGNLGCEGGLASYSFEYVKRNGGIDTEESYPYTGQDDYCQFKRFDVGATCTGYVGIPSGDEEALKIAVATVGPISVSIDASHRSFQMYQSGIYDDSECSTKNLNHAVLVIGYGTEGGKDYWLVKNSWGTTWGMKGYLMMSRNKDNQCGIATRATYPLV